MRVSTQQTPKDWLSLSSLDFQEPWQPNIARKMDGTSLPCRYRDRVEAHRSIYIDDTGTYDYPQQTSFETRSLTCVLPR